MKTFYVWVYDFLYYILLFSIIFKIANTKNLKYVHSLYLNKNLKLRMLDWNKSVDLYQIIYVLYSEICCLLYFFG